MSTPKPTLKQIFAQRINQQAQQVVLSYHALEANAGQARHESDALHNEADKLARMAARAEQVALAKVALNIAAIAKQIGSQAERRAQLSPALNQLVTELRQTLVRQTDRSTSSTPAKAWLEAGAERGCVYLALNDKALAKLLNRLLTALGLNCQELSPSKALNKPPLQQATTCIVLDGDIERASKLYRSINQHSQAILPGVFLSAETPDISTRLLAAQANISTLLSLQSPLHDIIQSITELLHPSAAPEHSYRVLVVDDSKSQTYVVQEALKKLGMQVRSLNEPQDCLKVMASFQPDIVLVDMYMPFCSGIELVKILKQVPEYRRLPIIYLSAEEDPLLQQQALSQGGDAFLCKPVPSAVLQQKITDLCRPRSRYRDSAHTDCTLTHSPSRPSQVSCLKQLQQHLAGTPSSALALIEIAALQDFASAQGLLASERAINSLALLLSQRLRQSDLSLRINDNSFIIALANTNDEQLVAIAEELCARFGELSAMFSPEPARLHLQHHPIQLSPAQVNSSSFDKHLAQLLYSR